MWRYGALLPVRKIENIVSLGEGMTPLLHLKNLGNEYGIPELYVKDESKNPTGSFKARGLSVAISKAKEFGVEHCIIPTAGNAGGAMAAYCAAAGMRATVVMPAHTPEIIKEECRQYGAELVIVNGLINDCAKKVAVIKEKFPCFDLSTFREPYRLEGKKTLGYEIAEQLDWQLPEVIFYPTGGGTGLVGIWKAFMEMQKLGWIGARLPRMIAVQSENCQPVVYSWKGLQPNARTYVGKPSIAYGLAVPNPFAEDLIMEVMRSSFGFPVAVSDSDMLIAAKELATKEGIWVSPEGGALWKALLTLVKQGLIKRNEKIVFLNTGSGQKYFKEIRS